MAAIDEVRGWLEEFKRDGSIRVDLPPQPNDECFNHIEHAPREHVVELRDKHLRHIVHWAYEKSQFYRKMWDEVGVKPEDIKTYDDMEKLPVWRKSQLRADEADYPLFGTRTVKELLPYVPALYRSTGTTGKPTMHPWLLEDIEALEESRVRWIWSGGSRPGGCFVDFAPVAKGSLVKVMNNAVGRVGLVHYHEEIFGYQADPAASAAFQLELGKHYNPLCTFMAPEFLIGLAAQFQKMGADPPYDVILPGGTPLSSRLRQQLRSVYKKPKGFPNIIGAYETAIATECLHSAANNLDFFHESEDLSVFEVVKPGTGIRAAPGERGELVITNFFNHVAPFVRFSLEDVFENSFTTEPCPHCGRTGKTWLKPIPGRLKDIFTVRGKELMPWDVELIIGDIPNTTLTYQLIFDDWDMDKLVVKIETTCELPDLNYEKHVSDELENRLNIPVYSEIVPAGTIPIAPGGYKVMKVIDNRPK
ncbi:MAG: hypothetical protein SVR08_12870 [Spirochaetota bacterium]|nr:hypothetical protein [Spirochaetota bacterium]